MAANDASQVSWDKGQPVLNRLPYYGYQDNPVAVALTSWIDSFLSDRKRQLEAFHQELDPDTCAVASLDYLGYLVGFSGDFWDLSWTPAVKRAFIRDSLRYFWQYRGTLACLRRVLDTHGLHYRIWQQNELVLPFTLSQPIGGQGMRVYVRLPLKYPRSGSDWKEAERSLRNFAPATTETYVDYEWFTLGFSRFGDHLYNSDISDTLRIPQGESLVFGQSYSASLQPPGRAGLLFYDPVPAAGNQGAIALSADGALTYTPAATWGAGLTDQLTYRVWDRQRGAAVTRSFALSLDPGLYYRYSLNSPGTPTEVNRGLVASPGNLTVVPPGTVGADGFLRVTSGVAGSLSTTCPLDDLDVSYRAWIVPLDTTQYYDIATRFQPGTNQHYLFRVTATAVIVFFFNGSTFSIFRSAAYPILQSSWRDIRVRLQGSAYEVWVDGSLRISGDDLALTTSDRLNWGMVGATPADTRICALAIRSA